SERQPGFPRYVRWRRWETRVEQPARAARPDLDGHQQERLNPVKRSDSSHRTPELRRHVVREQDRPHRLERRRSISFVQREQLQRLIFLDYIAGTWRGFDLDKQAAREWLDSSAQFRRAEVQQLYALGHQRHLQRQRL